MELDLTVTISLVRGIGILLAFALILAGPVLRLFGSSGFRVVGMSPARVSLAGLGLLVLVCGLAIDGLGQLVERLISLSGLAVLLCAIFARRRSPPESDPGGD